jgi:STE24 endopeptidase
MKLSSKSYELLTDGELKDQLESLAERIKFPLDRIFITSHNLTDPEAKCTSIGFITENINSKSIVLYKDAVRRCSVEEVCALVSSKLAHCKLDFNLKEFVLERAEVFYHFYLFITLLYNQKLANEFGLYNMPIIAHIALYLHVIAPINFTLNFFSNLVKRRHTIEAGKTNLLNLTKT